MENLNLRELSDKQLFDLLNQVTNEAYSRLVNYKEVGNDPEASADDEGEERPPQKPDNP